jgi:hypothetical protein
MRKQSIKATRHEEGAPVFTKDFKSILRRDKRRPFRVTVDNGACGPVGVWLTPSELAQAVLTLREVAGAGLQ